MITICVRVNAQAGQSQGIKEALAMYLELWGDTQIVSIQEDKPAGMEQMSLSDIMGNAHGQ